MTAQAGYTALWQLAPENWDKIVSGVYVYSLDTKTAYTLGDVPIPWPMIWLVATHSKKHVFDLQPVKPEFLSKGISSLVDRVKWRWRLGPPPADVKKFSSKSVPMHCEQIGPVDLELLCARVRMVGDEAIRKIVRKKTSSTNASALFCPQTRMGACVFVDRTQLKTLHDDARSSAMYTEVHPDSVPSDAIARAVRKHAKQVAQLEEQPPWEMELCKDLYRWGVAGTRSNLILTVKSHKPPGEVTTRNAHATQHNPFTPLGKYVSFKLLSVLKTFPHIMYSTDQFIEYITSIPITDDMKFIKADVKDFFIAGGHEHLATRSCAILPAKYRIVVSNVIRDMLHHQYISSNIASRDYEFGG
eukprot:6491606-Amphidinium_carterae.2